MTEQEKSPNSREKARATRALNDAHKKQLKKQVLEFKIVDNKLSKNKRTCLEGVFREAKWLTNEALASDDVFKYEWNKPAVGVRLPDGSIVEREYEYSPKLALEKTWVKIKQDVMNLSRAKKAGRKVGKLRFKKEINTVPLGNRSISVDLEQNKKQLRIAKIGLVHVYGLNQLDKVEEIGQAELVKRADGYYVKLLVYVDKSKNKTHRRNFGDLKPDGLSEAVGVDMGVISQVIASDGLVVEPSVIGELDRLRGLSAKLSRQCKGSNNYSKTLLKIKREYLRLSYKRDNLAYEIVRHLLDNHEVIYFQDENISSWKRKSGYVRAGRKLQHGILGRVKQLLVALVPTGRAVMLPKSNPTTQLCVCGVKNKHHVRERVYSCKSCDYAMGRDTHAALNMIRIGKYGHCVGNDLRKQVNVPTHLWSSGKPDYPAEHRITLEHAQSGVLATNTVGSLDSQKALMLV